MGKAGLTGLFALMYINVHLPDMQNHMATKFPVHPEFSGIP